MARKAPNTTDQVPQPHKAEAFNLTRTDLEAILKRRRATTVDELESVLAHRNDRQLQFSETEELELRTVCAKLPDRQHRAALRNGWEQAEEFVAQILG